MNWNRQTFEPHRPPPKHPDRVRFASPPLCRFFGLIGGNAIALLAYQGTAAILNVDWRMLHAGNWGFRELVTVAVSLLGLLIGGLFGFGLGLTVAVRSVQTNYVLTVLWHNLAVGQIVWMVMLGFLLTRTLGEHGALQLLEQFGPAYSALILVGNCAFWSIAIAGVLLVTTRRFEPRFFPCLLIALPFSLAMGYTQYRLLGLTGKDWLIISSLFPLILIPTSARNIARDLQQREELLVAQRYR